MMSLHKDCILPEDLCNCLAMLVQLCLEPSMPWLMTRGARLWSVWSL